MMLLISKRKSLWNVFFPNVVNKTLIEQSRSINSNETRNTIFTLRVWTTSVVKVKSKLSVIKLMERETVHSAYFSLVFNHLQDLAKIHHQQNRLAMATILVTVLNKFISFKTGSH